MRPLRFALLVAASCSMALATSAAQAQPGERWQLETSPEFGAPNSFATVEFGVPQTDNIAIFLSCEVSVGATPSVYGLFSAPTGSYVGNEDVSFEWRTALGSAQQPAILTLAHEFGGVGFSMPLDSILMNQLASAPQITYGIAEPVGIDQVSLDLAADQAEVRGFIDACQAMSNAVQGSANPPAAPSADLVPELGPSLTGHVWTRFTDVRDNVFETVLSVAYGVPETDDVFVTGQCVIGAQGPLVALQVAADIEGMAETAPAVLRVTADNGRSIDVEGSVIGTNAEFGVSGVDLVLETSDPAWMVIAGSETVQFERVGSRGGFTLTGNGPSTLGAFLADCDQIDALTPEGSSQPSAPIGAQDGFLSCDNFGRVGSGDLTQQSVVTFANESGQFRVLSWIDPNGAPIEQGGMNPGEQLSFTTGPGHVWMATDGPGNCREMIQPVVGEGLYQLLVE